MFIQAPEHDNESLLAEAEIISKEHSIPILRVGEEQGTEELTHCLSIASHTLGSTTTSLSTYAIGIQAFNSSDKDRKSKQRKHVKKRPPSQNPVYIDFLPPTKSNLGKRLNKQSNGEMLLKAAGINKMVDAIVYDLTAGFAQDSMIFASSENVKEVHMVERDPVVGLLLSDAMRRLELISTLDELICSDLIHRAKFLKEKLKLHTVDGREFASQLIVSKDSNVNFKQPDICYLDPMFPPRQKSAAVKKNMQILHGLLQSNHNEDDSFRLSEEVDLLDKALTLAKSRVVVKRPIHSPPLGIHARVKSDVRLPTYDLKGTINRFDVYIL
jgi:16S rRNA (guanine1516-N2)-methyltransferase